METKRSYNMTLDGLSSKTLSAERARDLMAMSQDNFDNALAVIRHMCDVQIEDAAKKYLGEIIFKIPTSLFGYDHYNVDDMGRRLAHNLNADGFGISGMPSMFKVIWGESKKLPLTKELLARKRRFDKPIQVPRI